MFNESPMPCLKENSITLQDKDGEIEVVTPHVEDNELLACANGTYYTDDVPLLGIEVEYDENPFDITNFAPC